VNLLASSLCQEIISVVDRANASTHALVELHLSNLKVLGNVNRFVISRMGSTGSTWLAKLLNAHPDVYCTHEGFLARVYPADHSSHEDILRFIDYFAWDTKHEAYRVLGDVGSVWPRHFAFLPSFTTAILVRHPARILKTRLAVYPKDQSFSEIPSETRSKIRQIWGVDIREYDPIDQIFLHDTFTFASQIWAIDKADLLIRIEDMQEAENCHRILRSLTGLDFSHTIVEQATQRRVNQRTPDTNSVSEIVAGFTSRQRDWYKLMLSDIVPYFGYGLLDDPEPCAPEMPLGRNVISEGQATHQENP
jgi:hypothetical protein